MKNMTLSVKALFVGAMILIGGSAHALTLKCDTKPMRGSPDRDDGVILAGKFRALCINPDSGAEYVTSIDVLGASLGASVAGEYVIKCAALNPIGDYVGAKVSVDVIGGVSSATFIGVLPTFGGCQVLGLQEGLRIEAGVAHMDIVPIDEYDRPVPANPPSVVYGRPYVR